MFFNFFVKFNFFDTEKNSVFSVRFRYLPKKNSVFRFGFGSLYQNRGKIRYKSMYNYLLFVLQIIDNYFSVEPL